MLRKLLKYEFQASARVLLPIYIALLVVALITNLIMRFNSGAAMVISTTLYGLLCVATFVITLIIIVQRFERNLLGDEGYLMLTLPTTGSKLIWSKLITSFVWLVVGSIAALFSALLLALSQELLTTAAEFFREFGQLLRYIFTEASFNDYIVFLEILLIGLIACGVFLMAIYLSLAIAQLPQFAKHRRFFGLATFFAQYLLLAIVYSTIFSNMPEVTLEYANETGLVTFGAAPILYLLVIFLVYAITFTAQFLGTKYILANKLNLE